MELPDEEPTPAAMPDPTPETDATHEAAPSAAAMDAPTPPSALHAPTARPTAAAKDSATAATVDVPEDEPAPEAIPPLKKLNSEPVFGGNGWLRPRRAIWDCGRGDYERR